MAKPVGTGVGGSSYCSVGGDMFTPCPPHESETLVYSCSVFDATANACTTYEWVELSSLHSSCQVGLDADDPQVGHLIGAVAVLFLTAFVFNFIFKYILNKR